MSRRQNIDLFPADLQRGRSREPLWVAGAVLLLAASLLVIGWWADSRHAHLLATHERLQAAQQALTAEIGTLQARVEGQRPDPTLLAEEARLQQVVRRKRRILDLILDEHLGNTTGFSGHLVALAQADAPPLWLEHIHLDHGGRVVRLSGRTLDAEALPSWLSRVTASDPFRAIDFNRFEIERSAEERGRLPAGYLWRVGTEPPTEGAS